VDCHILHPTISKGPTNLGFFLPCNQPSCRLQTSNLSYCWSRGLSLLVHRWVPPADMMLLGMASCHHHRMWCNVTNVNLESLKPIKFQSWRIVQSQCISSNYQMHVTLCGDSSQLTHLTYWSSIWQVTFRWLACN
jgi:hypothetical protein